MPISTSRLRLATRLGYGDPVRDRVEACKREAAVGKAVHCATIRLLRIMVSRSWRAFCQGMASDSGQRYVDVS